VALERRAIERLVVGTRGHELKNLLLVAQAALERLEQCDGEGRAEALRSLGEQLDRMAELADGLSASRSAPAGAMPVDVAALLEDTVLLARGLEPVVGCSLRQETAGPLPVVVDPERLRLLLLALLLNAAEATAGTGRIEVSARRAGDRLRLEVVDDGPGIPEADRERVFEPFFTTRPDGSGLGLFLARAYAEAEGGRIAAGDAEPGGARLVVEIPLRTAGR